MISYHDQTFLHPPQWQLLLVIKSIGAWGGNPGTVFADLKTRQEAVN